MKLLFVCTANQLRSPTAAAVFADEHETLSAGLSPFSPFPVNQDAVDWADKVFCFEDKQFKKLKKKFGVRATNLGVPDDYERHDPELVRLLKEKVPQFLD